MEELLLLARLDEGLPLAREAVEVELLLREAALRGMLLGQGDVVVEAPPGLSAIADPDRLLQVVCNLIGNAMRHGGEGVTVTLTARPVPAGGVVVDVADTGPGIAAADLPRVFDRFYRGSAARRGAPGGAGLGLAIVGSLVEAMGGTISVGLDARRGHDVLHPPAGRCQPGTGGQHSTAGARRRRRWTRTGGRAVRGSCRPKGQW